MEDVCDLLLNVYEKQTEQWKVDHLKYLDHLAQHDLKEGQLDEHENLGDLKHQGWNEERWLE